MKFVNLILPVALCLLLPLSAIAAGPTLSMTPTPLKVAVGQVVPLAVNVNDVEGMYGFDVQLKFDPAVVEVEDADPNTPGVQLLPGDFLSFDMAVRYEADNAEGTAWFAMTQVNPSEAKSGSGTLFTVLVKGKAPGKTAFEATTVVIADRNGEEIKVTWTNGSVEVSAARSATAPANPTPIPTAAAPQIDLTQIAEDSALTPALPAATATPKSLSTSTLAATATAPAPAQPAATAEPAPTVAPAAVVSPTPAGIAAAGATATPGVTPDATAPGAAATDGPESAAVTPVEDASSGVTAATAAAPATVVAPEALDAPTRVAAATQPARSDTLLFAGGGLLLLAAAAAAAFFVLRRGR